MHIIVIKSLFIFLAITFALLLIFREKIAKKIGDNLKISAFVSVIAGILLAYVITAASFLFVSENILGKIIMVFFALSPFIIGYFSTYEKVKIFTTLQIILAIMSAICVYFV